MLYDQSEKLGVAILLPSATISADNTPATVDLGTAGSCTIFLEVGVGGITFSGTNKVEFKLTHSDDDDTYEAVTLADVVGPTSVGTGGIVSSLVAAHAAATVEKIGYIGRKRYIKLLADFSGTHGTGTPMSALAVTGNLLSIAP